MFPRSRSTVQHSHRPADSQSWPGPPPVDPVEKSSTAPTPGHSGTRGVRPRTNARYTAVAACLILTLNVLVVAKYSVPFAEPLLGTWFLIINPTYLVATTSAWRGCSGVERIGYSLSAVLLSLMLLGLTANFLLPIVHIQRPLAPIPIVIMGDLLNVFTYAIWRRFPAAAGSPPVLRSFGPLGVRLFVGGVVAFIFSIAGANQLNNGAGDLVAVAALVAIITTLVLLLRWQSRIHEAVVGVTIYLLSAALLLMTSLRGWFITGHDIQFEYRVFQLTAAHAHWSFAQLRSPYNACLSITILPTEVAQVTHLDHPYVYKAVFQLIFAICPVLVYEIARRYWKRPIAILAAVYFMGFPTFINDMSFLNRQEIAFTFFCAAILIMTNGHWSLRRRQYTLVVAAIGIELSHYSTMYIFLFTLILAWLGRHAAVLAVSRLNGPDRSRHHCTPVRSAPSSTAGGACIAAVVLIALGWGGLATQTIGNVVQTANSAASALVGKGQGARSSDVSFSLFAGAAPNPRSILNSYHRQVVSIRANAPPGSYVSTSVVSSYATPVVPQSYLPLTKVGRALSDLSVPVSSANSTMRQAVAAGEQLFLGVGLIAIVVVRKRRRQISPEFLFLSLASVAVLAAVTVLPNLSVNYGVLRAFQSSLIIIAPILAEGSIILLRPLARNWAPRLAAAAAVILFAWTTSLMPQITGGALAELSLNNGGSYYNEYYTHQQDVAAVDWLANKPGVLPSGVQAPVVSPTADKFLFNSAGTVTGNQNITDIYPPLIREDTWVILGFSVVQTRTAVIFDDGDLITYRYPVDFLGKTKNLVFDNGGDEIYK